MRFRKNIPVALSDYQRGYLVAEGSQVVNCNMDGSIFTLKVDMLKKVIVAMG